ncbi:DUF742 domain-containing protein [Pseudonocardia sp. HH130630-07]|uniref:DUF742 domain-containing protein n=1 Tax=Pseudonocardia sp. HH130630-07 TaxID=1690815 RepID=UPI000814FC1A|nr:DUF742 domain-containing protein [Pseudonocardia sp. HH130630-07]ANY09210.1 hypothetical protein AFB00_26530 [Pseudonocardia sp. HH130630-07]
MARSEIGRTGARFGAPQQAPDPDDHRGPGPDDPPDVPAAHEPDPAAPEEDLVGVTGARFGGHSARRRRRSRRARAADAPAGRTPGEVPAPPEDTAVPAGPVTTGGAPPDRWTGPPAAETDDPGPVGRTVTARPYVLTGGRTRVRRELRIETLVSVRPGPGPARPESRERAAVLALCARARSVSEVAALAGVPLGVARVLIDDLAAEGRLTVHGVSSAEDGPSLELMDRVLAGLRRI